MLELKINGYENVFNTNHALHGHITIAFNLAKELGYPFISWNGRVYDMKEKEYGTLEELGLNSKEDKNADILNSNLCIKYGHIDKYKEVFKKSGYPYFKFNGHILDENENEFEAVQTKVEIKPKKKF